VYAGWLLQQGLHRMPLLLFLHKLLLLLVLLLMMSLLNSQKPSHRLQHHFQHQQRLLQPACWQRQQTQQLMSLQVHQIHHS
jgi:hypothetical protein